jgi:hypothetical protein
VVMAEEWRGVQCDSGYTYMQTYLFAWVTLKRCPPAARRENRALYVGRNLPRGAQAAHHQCVPPASLALGHEQVPAEKASAFKMVIYVA